MRRLSTALWIALAATPGLLLVPLVQPVSAQKFKTISEDKSKNETKKKADDSQYKAAIERLPEKKFDPWANMR